MKKSDLLISTPKGYNATLILAHGAGAPMDSDWMNQLTNEFVKNKIQVVRFEFPYMQERRQTGKKRPPNPAKKLIETWHEAIQLTNSKKPIYIGGKSMGGRIATMLENYEEVKGIVCLGFPFHAPGKSMGDRVEVLKQVKLPTLILQGERDSMGSLQEIKKLKLPRKIKVKFFADGDHSLKPRVKSGHTLDVHLENAANEAAKFLK